MKIVKIIKSIAARQIFAECSQVKRQLWEDGSGVTDILSFYTDKSIKKISVHQYNLFVDITLLLYNETRGHSSHFYLMF